MIDALYYGSLLQQLLRQSRSLMAVALIFSFMNLKNNWTNKVHDIWCWKSRYWRKDVAGLNQFLNWIWSNFRILWKLTTTSHPKQLNKKDHDIWCWKSNPGLGLGHGQNCGGVKSLFGLNLVEAMILWKESTNGVFHQKTLHNSTNIDKANNHLSSQTTEHQKQTKTYGV